MNINILLQNIGTIFPYIIAMILLLIIYSSIFTAWWKKQTVIMAWFIALLGMFVGPGLGFCIRMPGDGSDYTGLFAIIGINLFYLILSAGNFLQKKYWPANKLCNRIRFILQWPCLMT